MTGRFTVRFACCLALAVSSGKISKAQLLRVDWESRFGVPGSRLGERGRTVLRVSTGGYLVAGNAARSDLPWSVDAYLVRVDEHGDEIWSRHIDNSSVDDALSAVESANGGFVFTGATEGEYPCVLDCVPPRGDGSSDLLLIRTDASGAPMWTRVVGGRDAEIGRSVIETRDGALVVAGSRFSAEKGGWEFYVVKFEADGSESWQRTFGDDPHADACELIESRGGDYVVAGRIRAMNQPFDAYVVKISPNGDLKWERRVGDPNEHDEARSIASATDGGVVVVGSTSRHGESELYLFKVDDLGNLEWERSFPSTDPERPRASGLAIRNTPPGGYVLLGRASLQSDQSFLLRVDDRGEPVWSGLLPETRIGYGVLPTGDGANVVAGETTDSSGLDLLVMKVSGDFFQRGDADSDGMKSVSDAILVAAHLFQEGAKPTCLDSADIDDDGEVDIDDPVYLLQHLFRGGPQPPKPSVLCGTDPTKDDLNCEAVPRCMH